jgi:hypothetical protein
MRITLKREQVFLQINPIEMGCAPMKKTLHFTGQLQRLGKRAISRQKPTRVHPETVNFGFRQGPSEFSTAGIARYVED